VTDVRRDSIVSHRRPFAVAVPTLVERNTSEAIAKHHRNAIASVRRQTAAMQEKDRGAASAPIEVVKAHQADDHLMVVGQRNRIGMKIRDSKRGAEHRDFFSAFHLPRTVRDDRRYAETPWRRTLPGVAPVKRSPSQVTWPFTIT